jgi:hypothetical protein
MTNIFSTRFLGPRTEDEIRRLVTVRPDPITGLENERPAMAASRLTNALKGLYLPNQFSLDFIMENIDRAHSFSAESFPTDQHYQINLYNPPTIETFPMCLTGPAGVGKSQTLSALMKAMPGPTAYNSSHYLEAHTLISHWYASGQDKASSRQLLMGLLDSDAVEDRTNTSQLLSSCRRRAYRDGVSLVVLDEMQHHTTGGGVVRVTEILLMMAKLGIPMIYAANYSLGHKLLLRNVEDKQRLLSEPRVMLPDPPGSAAWEEYVRECIRVSGQRFAADPDALAHELYRCTYGIKRLAVHLLKAAYLEARAGKRHKIRLEDINQAYLSTSYSTNRKDIEDSFRLDLQKSRPRFRPDLRCPFDIPVQSNVILFARERRDERVNEQIFLSSLTEVERNNFELLHPQGSPSNPAIKPKAERKPSLPKQTREGLESAYSRLLAETKSPKPRGPVE